MQTQLNPHGKQQRVESGLQNHTQEGQEGFVKLSECREPGCKAKSDTNPIGVSEVQEMPVLLLRM